MKDLTRDMTSAGWPLLLLLIATAVAYGRVFSAGFLWDDSTFIVAEPNIAAGLQGLLNIWFKPYAMAEFHYWPLLYTGFWLEHKLWGFNPAGYHLTNLLLHGVNTLLLWHLMQRMKISGAMLIAGVFALHPVHVEAVAWVIARKDLQATLFFLLAFTCWLRFREGREATEGRGTDEGREKKARRARQTRQTRQIRKTQRIQKVQRARDARRAYLGLLLCYIAGLLSKSLILTLPAVLLLWCWWRHGHISARDWLHTAPLFAMGLLMTVLDLSVFIPQAVHDFEYQPLERLIIASKALWFYAGKLLWPEPLMFMYPHWDVSPARLLNWLPLVAGLALVAGLWFARYRLGRGPLAGVLFFAVTLSPVLGLVDFGYMQFAFAADRYQYLPGIGLIALLAGGGMSLYRHVSASFAAPPASVLWRYAGGGLVMALLLVYGLLTWQRSAVFQNDIGLFRHVVATNPGTPGAWFNLGTLLMGEDEEEAVQAFENALEYYPEDTQIYINLSSSLMELNHYEEALAYLQRAVLLQPDDFDGEKAPRRARHLSSGVHYNMGNALLELERPLQAEAAFEQALAVDPDNGQARQSLVVALHRRAAVHFGAARYDEAMALYRRSLVVDPENVDSLVNLGSVLGQLRRFEEAAANFERALEIDPTSEQARRNLQMAREQLNY